jgi:hypothetical protein
VNGESSRYALTAKLSYAREPATELKLVSPAGRVVRYLSRRLLPAADSIVAMQIYTVEPGDRIDRVAAKLLGDPLQYWRIADANDAMDPLELCGEPGRKLRIPAPQADIGPGPEAGSAAQEPPPAAALTGDDAQWADWTEAATAGESEEESP